MVRLSITCHGTTITRELDAPLCLDKAHTPTQRGPCVVRPTHGGATVTDADGRLIATLNKSTEVCIGQLVLKLEDSPCCSKTNSLGATERIVALRQSELLSLSLPDNRVTALSERNITLGTAADCELVIDDPTVSSHHCLVAHHGSDWVVSDLGSTNGVWVDGVRVASAALRHGAVLTIGRTRIVCRAPRAVPSDTTSLVGEAPAMLDVRAAIERFAPAPYPVLIEGESGVGKELVARALHLKGKRPNGPLVTVNCAAIAPEVIESELFGHERGAFTGAVQRRRGLFELAHRGTLFLDEVGELTLSAQAKLLRVLETQELRRVGGETTVRVDVRVVSATLRDLRVMVADGRFRPDLYFRLADFTLRVPPLRARRGDIPRLINVLLDRIEDDTARCGQLDDRALAKLMVHDWPGNVRELLSVLKRAVFLSDNGRIGPEHLMFRDGTVARESTYSAVTTDRPRGVCDRTIETTEKTARSAWPADVPPDDIAALYRHCDGNVSRLSKITGLARSTVRDRVARAMGSYPPPHEKRSEQTRTVD